MRATIRVSVIQNEIAWQIWKQSSLHRVCCNRLSFSEYFRSLRFKPKKEQAPPFEEDERRVGGGMRNEREREGGSMTSEGSAARSLFGNGISLDRSRD